MTTNSQWISWSLFNRSTFCCVILKPNCVCVFEKLVTFTCLQLLYYKTGNNQEMTQTMGIQVSWACDTWVGQFWVSEKIMGTDESWTFSRCKQNQRDLFPYSASVYIRHAESLSFLLQKQRNKHKKSIIYLKIKLHKSLIHLNLTNIFNLSTGDEHRKPREKSGLT